MLVAARVKMLSFLHSLGHQYQVILFESKDLSVMTSFHSKLTTY